MLAGSVACLLDSSRSRLQDVIGAGGMARVYKGKYAGTDVAIKEVAVKSAFTQSVRQLEPNRGHASAGTE